MTGARDLHRHLTPEVAAAQSGSLAACLPAVDVIVPVFNEVDTVSEKLADLERIDYPRDRLRVLVVDGGSSDGTSQAARAWAGRNGLAIEVHETPAVGKPAQVNAGLRVSQAPWVLVTDADARLPRDVLLTMMRLALADPKVALVGAPVQPWAGHPFDGAHWTVSNWLRRAERCCGCAGLVVGPCYLARRELLGAFAPDTVADDVSVTCRAMLAGARIELTPTPVVELRAPERNVELLRHKLRKALAYLREVYRYLPRAALAAFPPCGIFLWRAGLLIGPPLLLLGLLGVAGLQAGWRWAAAFAVMAASMALAAPAASRWRRWPRAVSIVSVPVVAAFVLTAAFLLYPFVRVSSRYRKVPLHARHPDRAHSS